jgi:8-oxo-(d)GTP phosphatase
MADITLDEPPVLAAGAVCWRRRGTGVEVLVISRPSRGDLTLPKGKVESGETLPETAVREIFEETGFRVALGVPLGVTEYVLPTGRDKVVTYWAAEVTIDQLERGRFKPTEEVDRVDWVPLSKAGKQLSYERDAELLARFAALMAAGQVASFAVIALRHAKAEFDSESGADADRVLTGRGTDQARAVVPVLAAWGPLSIVTSTAARCVATVTPLAKQLDLKIKEHRSISQDGWEAAEHNPTAIRRLVARRIEKQRTTVFCSHAPVLPELLEQIAQATSSANGGRMTRAGILATAEFAVVHLAFEAPHTILAIETHSTDR